MKRIAAMIVFFFMFSMTCALFAQDKVDNPMYQKWAKFKIGTSVKYKQESDVAGNKTESDIVYTLAELTPEKVVVEMSGSMAVMGKPVDMPKTKMEYLAKVDKVAPATAEAAKPKESDEELSIAGGKYKCHVVETEVKVGEGSVVSKIWSSDDVPGSMVKTLSNMEKPMKTTTSITLVEVKQP
ncbi:MAG: hypothetical protein HQM08_07230 [Candidatus Riflebacteria bacterium]|nr:hypothetical protein [Candidatus Riflebacteria bacterium]